MTEFKVYLDSSFIISFVFEDHEFYGQAIGIAKSLDACPKYISPLVIDEALYGLSKYGFKKKDIVQKLEDIVRLESVYMIGIIDKSDLIRYMNDWVKSSFRPRDYMHMHLMKENNINHIASFDEDFSKNARGITVLN
jgi:predicted nucleic acid-binding protein